MRLNIFNGITFIERHKCEIVKRVTSMKNCRFHDIFPEKFELENKNT